MAKRRQRWLLAAIAASLVIAALCCTAAIVGFRWLMNDEPSNAVDAYLKAVHQQDALQARELVCEDERDSAHKGRIGLLIMYSDVVDWDIIRSSTHGQSAEVVARVFTRRDSGANMIFTLSNEENAWRVCNIDLSLS
jgi:hypothetical protein